MVSPERESSVQRYAHTSVDGFQKGERARRMEDVADGAIPLELVEMAKDDMLDAR